MSVNNTRNLIQVEGGEKIKQADKGSYLAYQLVDSKRNPINSLNGSTAQIAVYTKTGNKKWQTSATVSNATVRFSLPGNLDVATYDLDITVAGMVFPSDRRTKVDVIEGYLTTMTSATAPIIDLDNYAKKTDLNTKVDKVTGKGLSTNDFTNTHKSKVDAIPSNPQYTDTTYRAGTGLALSGTTFSVDSTVAKKTDIPDISGKVDKVAGKGLSTNDYDSTAKAKVDGIPTNPKYTDTTYRAGTGLTLSGTTFAIASTVALKTDIPSLAGYAKLSDIPDIDTKLGTIDLTKYATKADLDNKVDKVTGKQLSSNDYTNADKAKLQGIDLSKYALKTDVQGGSSGPNLYTWRDMTNGKLPQSNLGDYVIDTDGTLGKINSNTSNSFGYVGYMTLLSKENFSQHTKDLELITTNDLSNYVTKTELSKINVSGDRLKQLDTRRDNKAPSHYIDNYSQSIITEFKYCNVVGTDTIFKGAYCNVTTVTPWRDPSGGLPVQYATSNTDNGTMAIRSAINATVWGPWTKVGADEVDLSGYALKSQIPNLTEYAKKTDLPDMSDVAKLTHIPNNGAIIYDNDTIDYAKAEVGKDWFLRNDGLMGPISSIDREAKSLRFNTRFTLGFPFARKKDIPDVSTLVLKSDVIKYSGGYGINVSSSGVISADTYILAKKNDLTEYAKRSDIPDLSNYALKTDIPSTTDLNNKVDKVSGKGLSTYDFTYSYKSKLDGIPSYPKYTDTTYTAGTGLNLNGTTFSVDGSVLRVNDLVAYATKINVSEKVYEVAQSRPVLYTFMDFDILPYLLSRDEPKPGSLYDEKLAEKTAILNSYYLSREGYIAKIKDYNPTTTTAMKDYKPLPGKSYIRISLL